MTVIIVLVSDTTSLCGNTVDVITRTIYMLLLKVLESVVESHTNGLHPVCLAKMKRECHCGVSV